MKASRFNVYEEDEKIALIANTHSGAVVKVSKEVAGALRNKQTPLEEFFSARPQVKDHLMKKGILLPNNVNEEKSLQIEIEKIQSGTKKLSYSIATTMACNFDCPYCFQEREAAAIGEEVRAAILRYIESQIDTSTKSLFVCWYGGEPTLTPSIIYGMSEKLIALAKEHGLSYSAAIITNGYLLDQEMLEKLRAYNVETIQITIDGSKKTHDSRRYLRGGKPTYDVIMSNVKLASHMGFKVKLRVNIDKDNYQEYEIVKEEASDFPNVTCYAEVLFDASTQDKNEKTKHFSKEDDFRQARRENEQAMTLQGIMDRKSMCSAACSTGKTIHPTGLIFDCITDISEPEKASGTVFEPAKSAAKVYDISYIWENEECKSCAYLPVCFGGCPKHYRENGMLKCTRTKATLPQLLAEYLAQSGQQE